MISRQIHPSSPLVLARKRDTAAIELVLSAVAIVLMLFKSVQDQIRRSSSSFEHRMEDTLQSLLNFLNTDKYRNGLRCKMRRAGTLRDESQIMDQITPKAVEQIITCIDTMAGKNYSFHPTCQNIVTRFHAVLGGISTFDDISRARVVYW